MAFLDAEPESGLSWVRLWDITREQFEDIASMENSLEPGAVVLDWAQFVRVGGSEIAGGGWYNQGLYLGDYQDSPVVTFTGDASLPWACPGEAYKSVILEGLRECGLGEDEVLDYSSRWGI